MVFKNPYSFLVKHFKLVHLIFAGILGYLILKTNSLINFLYDFMHSSQSVVGADLQGTFFNFFVFFIPVLLIAFSIIAVGLLFKRNKPYVFYIITIFSYILVIITFIYSDSFLGTMEKSVVSLKSAKIVYDLLVLAFMIEGVTFIMYIIRGLGFNIKQFDFSSELEQLDLTDDDVKEIELDVTIDLDERKRKSLKRLRELKYYYYENQFILNIIFGVLGIIILISSTVSIVKYLKTNKEGNVISVGGISFAVEDTYITQENYLGKKISENYLVIIRLKMKTNYNDVKVIKNDFVLHSGMYSLKPTDDMCLKLSDFGKCLKIDSLSNEFNEFILIYELPKSQYRRSLKLQYYNQNNKTVIKLKKKTVDIYDDKEYTYKIGDKLTFDKKGVGELEFSAKSYEIADRFKINYNYCVNKNDCIPSVEYITPNINASYDKLLLKIIYEGSSNVRDIISSFGTLEYTIGNKKHVQSNLSVVKSSKKKEKGILYIEANNKIKEASDIKLVFNMRNDIYRYNIKGANNE